VGEDQKGTIGVVAEARQAMERLYIITYGKVPWKLFGVGIMDSAGDG